MRARVVLPVHKKCVNGFTLLELVIGIVVFTISLTVVFCRLLSRKLNKPQSHFVR